VKWLNEKIKNKRHAEFGCENRLEIRHKVEKGIRN
jgi:hypothetical protein